MATSPVSQFLNTGTMPDLSKLNHRQLEVLMVELADIKHSLSPLMKSVTMKAAASNKLDQIERAENMIAAAYKALPRR